LPSRLCRRASLLAIPALTLLDALYNLCASVLSISASGRVKGRLCSATRARGAFAHGRACVKLHTNKQSILSISVGARKQGVLTVRAHDSRR
jgi:hypothetical protein